MARKNASLFARFDLDYGDHPKIQALSDGAFRAHVEMILYARKYLTDGRIPNRVANRFGSESLTELQRNDPERPSLVQDEHGDYWLHDYADHQETKDEVETRRLVNARNGKRGGRTVQRPGKRNVTQSVTDSVTEPGSEIEAETETETETYLSSSTNADASETEPIRDDVSALCRRLVERMVDNGNRKPTITKQWREQARLLLDRDRRDLDEALALIDWCQDDDFWSANIHSLPTFRKQYDKLRLKAGRHLTVIPGRTDDSDADDGWGTPAPTPDGLLPAWDEDAL